MMQSNVPEGMWSAEVKSPTNVAFGLPSATAILYYQYDDGAVQAMNMARAKDGSFLSSLEAKGSQLKLWMESGDDKTQPVTVAVLQRLAIQSVSLVVKPPAYTALKAYDVDLVGKPASVVYGSDVELHVAHLRWPLPQAVPSQAPVSAITLPSITPPTEIFASNHNFTRLSLLVCPVMPRAVMHTPLPETSRLEAGKV